MIPDIKAKAIQFLNEYSLTTVTLNDLRRIIQEQGYTIVEFNHIFNDDDVRTLVDSLGLGSMLDKSRSFTYADNHRRIVFLHEDLSEDEKRLVLAHEEGHIYCGHLLSNSIIGKDVVEEYEANEFTHYILKPNTGRKLRAAFRSHKKTTFIVAAVLIALTIGSVIFGFVQKEQRHYGEYYLTSSGNKFHESQCIFVKDKITVHRMTITEFESGDYEPCEICLP